jgi:hypothetical protein
MAQERPHPHLPGYFPSFSYQNIQVYIPSALQGTAYLIILGYQLANLYEVFQSKTGFHIDLTCSYYLFFKTAFAFFIISSSKLISSALNSFATCTTMASIPRNPVFAAMSAASIAASSRITKETLSVLISSFFYGYSQFLRTCSSFDCSHYFDQD